LSTLEQYGLNGWQALWGQEVVKIFQSIASDNAYTSEVSEGKGCNVISAVDTAAGMLSR